MITTILILTFLCTTFQTDGSRPEVWKGIIPLYSTRQDVERLLGPSPEGCRCIYRTNDETVFVDYSDGPCQGNLHGWSVPADTVLMVTVQPNSQQPFSELRLDLGRYVKTYGDTNEVYYTDKSAGVRYQVDDLGIIRSVSYIPDAKSYTLLCPGFPTADLGHREFKPLETYSDIPIHDEHAKLENFLVRLLENPETRGYILFYASKDFSSRKARARAQRAKDHLVKRRSMVARKIDIIDGGYREQFKIELYVLPLNVGKPTAYPTVAAPKIKTAKDRKARITKRSLSKGRWIQV